MRKTLCIIGLLGTIGLFTACGTGGVEKTREEQTGRVELPNAQPLSVQSRMSEPGGSGEDTELPSEFMAYLRGFADGSVTVDIVEWVTVPGSRADELGFNEDDAPGGFVVYNPDEAERSAALSDDCGIKILVWENNNEEKAVSADEFAAILKERGDQGLETPYRFTVKDGRIVSVQEQYVP